MCTSAGRILEFVNTNGDTSGDTSEDTSGCTSGYNSGDGTDARVQLATHFCSF